MFADANSHDLIDIDSDQFSEIEIRFTAGGKFWRIFTFDCVQLRKHVEWLAVTAQSANSKNVRDLKMVVQPLEWIQSLPRKGDDLKTTIGEKHNIQQYQQERKGCEAEYVTLHNDDDDDDE
eukprot:TRINITY_DN8570_c0_g1_i1.p2 TRINITY_DN8570_c0_g1~~TRINITY_DN8570_c0_g1_i1.p2  ORF type:complete len:121 (-),score=25.76 TRINITY_DN8570_c0_g1_i1:3-365(-)